MRSLRAAFLCTTLVSALVAAPAVAEASGVPAFDADKETIVWGRFKPTAPIVRGKALTKGAWSEVAGTLVVDPADTTTRNFMWMPEGKNGRIADGMFRVRLSVGKRLDAGILLRAGDKLSALSGYELTLDKTTLRLQRYDKGKILPVGEEVKVRRLDRRATLEVVVYLVGPQLLVTVYDGDTFDRLATLAAHETTYTTGRVGLRVGAKADGVGFTLVSTQQSNDPSSVRNPKFGRWYGHDASPGTTPFGNTRFAFVPQSAVGRLPRDLQKAEQTQLPGEHGKRSLLFLDTKGFERLRRTGAEVLSVDSNVAWKVLNPPFLAREGKSPTAKGRGFRLDQSYKDPQMVEDLLTAYHRKYPDVTRLKKVGRSHRGRTIWAIKISDNPQDDEDEPSVLLSGGHHASELLAVEYPLDAMAQLLERYGRDRTITKWIDEMEIYVVPLVNPDGNAMFIHETRFATRKNARDTNHDGVHDPFEGVDLNRNYPFGWGKEGSSGRSFSRYFRGLGPGSEPESASMMALAHRQHFAASISFHTVGRAVFSPYTVKGVQNPDPDVALAVAMDMVAAVEPRDDEEEYEVRPNGYPVAGSDQDWYLHAHGTLAYIVEGTHHNPPLSVRQRAIDVARPLWQTLLDRVASGSRISGHVKTAADKPLEAEVKIVRRGGKSGLHAGERWTSRALDGRFDRLVIGPGKYTVTVTAAGYQPRSQDIRVRSKPTSIDIILDPA